MNSGYGEYSEPQDETANRPVDVTSRTAPNAGVAFSLPNGWNVQGELGASEKGGEAELFLVRREGVAAVAKVYRISARGIAYEPNRDLLGVVQRQKSDRIIRIHEFGQCAEGRFFEVMEYCAAGDLKKLGRRFDEPALRLILEQVADGVQSLHAAGIVHRDIKPGNILLRSERPLDLALADFGISSFGGKTVIKGLKNYTVRYASLTQLFGGVEFADDWWSLGMVMMELLWGEHPFSQFGEDKEIIKLQINRYKPEIPPRADGSWLALFEGLLAPNPNDRWGYEKVKNWLAGRHSTSQPAAQRASAPYLFKNVKHHTAAGLAEAMGQDWAGAISNLSRGYIVKWVEEKLENYDLAGRLRDIQERAGLSQDERLALSLSQMNPGLPLIWMGKAVTADLFWSDPAALGTLLTSRIAEELKPKLKEVLNLTIKGEAFLKGKALSPAQEVCVRRLLATERVFWKGAEVSLPWLQANAHNLEELFAAPMRQVFTQLKLEPFLTHALNLQTVWEAGLKPEQNRLLHPLAINPSAQVILADRELRPETVAALWRENPAEAEWVLDERFAAVFDRLARQPWLLEVSRQVVKLRALARKQGLSEAAAGYLIARVVFKDAAALVDGHPLDAAWFLKNPEPGRVVLVSALPELVSQLCRDGYLKSLQARTSCLASLGDAHQRILYPLAIDPQARVEVDGEAFDAAWLVDHAGRAFEFLDEDFLAAWESLGGADWLKPIRGQFQMCGAMPRLSVDQLGVLIPLAARPGYRWLVGGAEATAAGILSGGKRMEFALQAPFPEIYRRITGQDWLADLAARFQALMSLKPDQRRAGSQMLLDRSAGLRAGEAVLTPPQAMARADVSGSILTPDSGAVYALLTGNDLWRKAGELVPLLAGLTPAQRANAGRWLQDPRAPLQIGDQVITERDPGALLDYFGELIHGPFAKVHRLLTGATWLGVWNEAAEKAGKLGEKAGLKADLVEALKRLGAQVQAGLEPERLCLVVAGNTVTESWLVDQLDWAWDNLTGEFPELAAKLSGPRFLCGIKDRLALLEGLAPEEQRLLFPLVIRPGEALIASGSPLDARWLAGNPLRAKNILGEKFVAAFEGLGGGGWLRELRNKLDATGKLNALTPEQLAALVPLAAEPQSAWNVAGTPVSAETILTSGRKLACLLQPPLPEVHQGLTGQDWLVEFAKRYGCLSALMDSAQRQAGALMLLDSRAGIRCGNENLSPVEALRRPQVAGTILTPESGEVYARLTRDDTWKRAGQAAPLLAALTGEQSANVLSWITNPQAPLTFQGQTVSPGDQGLINQNLEQLFCPPFAQLHRALTGQEWLAECNRAAAVAEGQGKEAGLAPPLLAALQRLAFLVAAGIPAQNLPILVEGGELNRDWLLNNPGPGRDLLAGAFPRLAVQSGGPAWLEAVARRYQELAKLPESLVAVFYPLAIDPSLPPAIGSQAAPAEFNLNWLFSNPEVAVTLLESGLPEFWRDQRKEAWLMEVAESWRACWRGKKMLESITAKERALPWFLAAPDARQERARVLLEQYAGAREKALDGLWGWDVSLGDAECVALCAVEEAQLLTAAEKGEAELPGARRYLETLKIDLDWDLAAELIRAQNWSRVRTLWEKAKAAPWPQGRAPVSLAGLLAEKKPSYRQAVAVCAAHVAALRKQAAQRKADGEFQGTAGNTERGSHSMADPPVRETLNPPGAAGPPIQPPPIQNEEAQRPAAFYPTLLLGLCFGIIGVHRFYLRKIGTGILQLCTFGGLGVWWLIDIITILCGKFRDKRGAVIPNVSPKLTWCIFVLMIILCWTQKSP